MQLIAEQREEAHSKKCAKLEGSKGVGTKGPEEGGSEAKQNSSGEKKKPGEGGGGESKTLYSLDLEVRSETKDPQIWPRSEVSQGRGGGERLEEGSSKGGGSGCRMMEKKDGDGGRKGES